MKKNKKILPILLIGLLTAGCTNNQTPNEEKEPIANVEVSENYTEIDALFDKKIKLC